LDLRDTSNLSASAAKVLVALMVHLQPSCRLPSLSYHVEASAKGPIRDQLFARAIGCWALARPALALTPSTLAKRMLDSDLKLGTSTSYPSGYAWEAFRKIDAATKARFGLGTPEQGRAIRTFDCRSFDCRRSRDSYRRSPSAALLAGEDSKSGCEAAADVSTVISRCAVISASLGHRLCTADAGGSRTLLPLEVG
jgi:hypothetical protein